MAHNIRRITRIASADGDTVDANSSLALRRQVYVLGSSAFEWTNWVVLKKNYNIDFQCYEHRLLSF